MIGRADDVLNVAGHRIGTAEVESALVSHPAVAEAAAIGIPDALKGEAIVWLRAAARRPRRDGRADRQPDRTCHAANSAPSRHLRRLSLSRAAQDALRQDHAPAIEGAGDWRRDRRSVNLGAVMGGEAVCDTQSALECSRHSKTSDVAIELLSHTLNTPALIGGSLNVHDPARQPAQISIPSSPRNAAFPPPPEFSKNAHINSKEDYDKLCARAAADPEGFWADIARELHWFKPWDKVLEWDAPVGEVVPRRQDQSLLQLPRPARRRPGARTRPPSSGRASPAKFAPTPISSC